MPRPDPTDASTQHYIPRAAAVAAKEEAREHPQLYPSGRSSRLPVARGGSRAPANGKTGAAGTSHLRLGALRSTSTPVCSACAAFLADRKERPHDTPMKIATVPQASSGDPPQKPAGGRLGTVGSYHRCQLCPVPALPSPKQLQPGEDPCRIRPLHHGAPYAATSGTSASRTPCPMAETCSLAHGRSPAQRGDLPGLKRRNNGSEPSGYQSHFTRLLIQKAY